jgi:hypothetical protein
MYPMLLLSVNGYVTNSIELNPSRKTTSCGATQEHTNILRIPKFHYGFRKSAPLVPILSEISPVHTTQSYLSKVYFSIIRPLMFWSSG